MPLNIEEEQKVSGHGYYTSSAFTVRYLLENVASAVEDSFALEDTKPRPYSSDTRVFKISITVEEV